MSPRPSYTATEIPSGPFSEAAWAICRFTEAARRLPTNANTLMSVMVVFLICVGDPRKGWGSVELSPCCLASFRLCASWRWTAVGVEVERPQRSEDERPRGRRGSAANLAGRGRGKDVAVQVICCLLGEKNVLRETTSHVPAPSLIWVHGRGPAT